VGSPLGKDRGQTGALARCFAGRGLLSGIVLHCLHVLLCCHEHHGCLLRAIRREFDSFLLLVTNAHIPLITALVPATSMAVNRSHTARKVQEAELQVVGGFESRELLVEVCVCVCVRVCVCGHSIASHDCTSVATMESESVVCLLPWSCLAILVVHTRLFFS
jgi:hypothetical protein